MWMNGRTDRQTDRQDKAYSRFSQFAKAPKNDEVLSSSVSEQTWFLSSTLYFSISYVPCTLVFVT